MCVFFFIQSVEVQPPRQDVSLHFRQLHSYGKFSNVIVSEDVNFV